MSLTDDSSEPILYSVEDISTALAHEPEFLPTRDEKGDSWRWKPWQLKAYASKGGHLTPDQEERVRRFDRAQMLRIARERAKVKARVEKWCAVIVQMKMQHKSYDEIGDRVGVAGTTIIEWESLFPDIFEPEYVAWTKRAQNSARLAAAQSYIAAKQKLATEALPSVETIVELRDDRERDEGGKFLVSPKVRLEAAKTILSGIGIGREKETHSGITYSADRVRVIQTVIEEILPGEEPLALEAQFEEVRDAGKTGEGVESPSAETVPVEQGEAGRIRLWDASKDGVEAGEGEG